MFFLSKKKIYVNRRSEKYTRKRTKYARRDHGNVSKSFRISPLKVTDSSKFSVDFDRDKAYEYRASGTKVEGLVVKYLGETGQDTDDRILIPGVDYKVTYSNNKKVSGTKEAELKLTFLGNYKGSSAVVDPDLYDIVWTDATEKGRAMVVICGKAAATEKDFAVGSKNQTISIKAMVLKGRTLGSFLGR